MIAALLAVAAAASAPPPKPGPINVWIVGGAQSCAAWVESGGPRNPAWVLGFWSGMNFERSAMVGHGTDTPGIVAEINKTCNDQPSQALIAAVAATYERLEAAGR